MVDFFEELFRSMTVAMYAHKKMKTNSEEHPCTVSAGYPARLLESAGGLQQRRAVSRLLLTYVEEKGVQEWLCDVAHPYRSIR